MHAMSLTPSEAVCIVAARNLAGNVVETLGYVSVEHAVRHVRSCGWTPLYVVRRKEVARSGPKGYG